jgi:hypothetical protein
MITKFVRRRAVLLLILLTTGIAVPAFSQSESVFSDLPQKTKTNWAADLFYSLFDLNSSNLALNLGGRLAGNSYYNTTFGSIAENIYPGSWYWENGDRFLINQFGHPYQGSTYFASARINGFNFYQSIPFALFGSFQWETMYEMDSSINDLVSTTVGGVFLGEMLHRLFLEIDESPSAGAKIGSFFVSPVGRFNAMHHRPKRENGGNNIRSVMLKAGFEKSFPQFTGHQAEADSWRYPGGYLGVNVVYGDPFTQESRKPYRHFELGVDFTTNIDSYNMQLLSDGYIFSFDPSYADRSSSASIRKTHTSTGLTAHFDLFNVSNDIKDNVGYGNIQFSSNAVDWTVKHAITFSEQVSLSVKAHAGFVLWGASMYNNDIMSDTYLDNTRNTYGMGENLKLFFTVSLKKGGTLEFAATGYHIFNLPVTDTHSGGNVYFINCSVACGIPFTERVGIGAAFRYWNLCGLYDAADNVYRSQMAASTYTSFKF